MPRQEEAEKNGSPAAASAPSDSGVRLDGWKEISAYLRCDTRTCMRWEKDQGLPIHRINQDAKKSKVIAYAADLDRWLLRGRPKNGNLEKDTAPGARRIPWGIIAAAVIIAIGAAVFLISSLKRSSGPADVRVQGQTLSIIDSEGRTLWAIDIPASEDQKSFYADSLYRTMTRHRVVIFKDDGDGEKKIALFLNNDVPEKRAIALYDHKGTRLWLREIHYDVEYTRTQWGTDFLPFQIVAEDVNGDGRQEILALWGHRRECPSIFQVLSLEGEELGHYEHTGILQLFAVHHRDDQAADILLGGTNNLLDGDAVLIGIDGRDLSAGLGPPYAIPEDLKDRALRLESFVPRPTPRAKQKYYIRFRHNEISRGLGTQWMWTSGISPTSKRIGIELLLAENAYLNYDFSPTLSLEGIRPNSDFVRAFPDWQARGIVKGSLDSFLERCRRDITYWDGKSWAAFPPSSIK